MVKANYGNPGLCDMLSVPLTMVRISEMFRGRPESRSELKGGKIFRWQYRPNKSEGCNIFGPLSPLHAAGFGFVNTQYKAKSPKYAEDYRWGECCCNHSPT